MNEQRMARSDVWRHHYRADRYARLLSQPELDQRLQDVLFNLLCLGRGGIEFAAMTIGPDEVSNTSTVWPEKWTHMLEEMVLRYGPYPAGFTPHTISRESLPDFTSDLARKAAGRLAALAAQASDVFIRYGKRDIMDALYRSGALRIQPATSFARTSHNRARQDDELKIPLSIIATRDDLLTVLSNPDDVPPDMEHARVDVTMQLPSDYWLYCVSSALIPRLFVDYEAEACVIIRDRDRFTRMLQETSMQKLSGTTLRAGVVEYVDPLLPTSLVTAVAFTKHFRYSYQQEFRFCWLPPHNIDRAKHCDIEIGSIAEFSDLIVL